MFGVRSVRLKGFTDWTVLSGVWCQICACERVHRLDCIIRCCGVRSARVKGFTDWTVLSGVVVSDLRLKGFTDWTVLSGVWCQICACERVHRLDCIIRCSGVRSARVKGFTDWTVLSGVWCQICACERVHRLDCIIRCLVSDLCV